MTERESVEPRHPFVEMTVTRLLLLVREPEMIFWVFIFPLLMALALGIAFQSPSETPVAVAVERGAGAAELRDALAAHESVEIVSLAPGATAAALRDGLAHVVVAPGNPPTYRYDPTRPESRLARQTVDDLLQRAAGRQDVWTGRNETVTAPGSRYIDWLIPGLLGNEHHGDRHVGHRLHAGRATHAQAAQAADRHADAAPPVPGRPRDGASGAARARAGGPWSVSPG